jgi:hypothetical protein
LFYCANIDLGDAFGNGWFTTVVVYITVWGKETREKERDFMFFSEKFWGKNSYDG